MAYYGPFDNPLVARQMQPTQTNFAPALIGGGMSLLGGLLGGTSGPKRLSPQDIQRLYGPQALAAQTQQLYALLAHSPIFQQMMGGAAQQGAQLRNRLGAQLGRSGLGGTPYGGFLKAASLGYGSQLQRQGQSQLFAQALQTALQNLQNQMSFYGQQQQLPSFGQQLGGSLLAGGAQGLASLFGK